jgi:ribosomal protein S18 acetylase RimI-like enzyme
MNVEFTYCDFENPDHLRSLARMVNLYMADPMGGDRQLSKIEQLRLVDGLANHPTAIVLLQLADSQVVGYAVGFVNFSTFLAKPMFNIHDFFVMSEFRGLGLGNQLMNQLTLIAQEKKCKKISLEVRSDNLVAQRIYSNQGFGACEPEMLFWTKTL